MISYAIRLVRVMYDRHIYRQSHEGLFERHCDRVERKWKAPK